MAKKEEAGGLTVEDIEWLRKNLGKDALKLGRHDMILFCKNGELHVVSNKGVICPLKKAKAKR